LNTNIVPEKISTAAWSAVHEKRKWLAFGRYDCVYTIDDKNAHKEYSCIRVKESIYTNQQHDRPFMRKENGALISLSCIRVKAMNHFN
jgi:hypothetical protein